MSFALDYIDKERQRSEAVQALRENERRLSTLLSNLPGMAYRCRMDEQWTMEFVSEGCQELTGYAPSDLVLNKRLCYADLIHPEDEAQVRALVEAAVLRNTRFHAVYRIRTASGSEKWVAEHGVAVRAPNGDVVALEGIIGDITKRKETELRIRAFSDLGLKLSAARTAVEAAETMVQTAGELLEYDACSVQIYSRQTDRMQHVLHQDTIEGVRQKTAPHRNHAPPSELARRVLNEGGQLILKKNASEVTPGGSPFGDVRRLSASIILAPIRDGSQVIGMVSLHSYSLGAYDEQSLETLQALADHCGGAWTRIQAHESLQALEQQLRHSQKMEAVGQLAGGVAHDFNNLLTVMRGNADLALMEEQKLTPTSRKCLKQIIAAAERAANLTRQLLVFSRKQVIQVGPVDLNDVIRNLTSMLKRIIGENITLKCEYRPRILLHPGRRGHDRADPGEFGGQRP